MLNIMETFNTRLKQALETKGISASELARRVGVTRGAVSMWLKGDVQAVNSRRLLSLANALGIDPTWLASGQGSMESSSFTLTREEEALLTALRQLSRQKQKIVVNTTKTLIEQLL